MIRHRVAHIDVYEALDRRWFLVPEGGRWLLQSEDLAELRPLPPIEHRTAARRWAADLFGSCDDLTPIGELVSIPRRHQAATTPGGNHP